MGCFWDLDVVTARTVCTLVRVNACFAKHLAASGAFYWVKNDLGALDTKEMVPFL